MEIYDFIIQPQDRFSMTEVAHSEVLFLSLGISPNDSMLHSND